MHRISTHFTHREIERSETADRRGLTNRATPDVVRNAARLAIYVLEPLRALAGDHPINVSSWFRSMALNKAVGGSDHSYHLFGCAADIWSDHHAPADLAKIVLDSRLGFDEMYVEYGSTSHWLHLAVPLTPYARPRYEVGTISWRDGERVTRAGIHMNDA